MVIKFLEFSRRCIYGLLCTMLFDNLHADYNSKEDQDKKRFGASFIKGGDVSDFIIKCTRLNVTLDLNAPVLDLGTGCGVALVKLYKMGFKDLNAVDSRQYKCFHHNMLINRMLNKVKFFRGSINTSALSSVADHSFGVVLALNIFNEMPDAQIEVYFKRIHNLLKTGGVLYIKANRYQKQATSHDYGEFQQKKVKESDVSSIEQIGDDENVNSFINDVSAHKLALFALKTDFQVLDIFESEEGYSTALLRKPIKKY